MNKSEILSTIRNQLELLSDIQTKETSKRFFKEPILVYGVKSALVQRLAKDTWKEIKDLPKQEIF
jgi:hypothetical protein